MKKIKELYELIDKKNIIKIICTSPILKGNAKRIDIEKKKPAFKSQSTLKTKYIMVQLTLVM